MKMQMPVYAIIALFLLAAQACALSPEYFSAVKASEFSLMNKTIGAGSVQQGTVVLSNTLDYPLPKTSLILQLVRNAGESFDVFEEQEVETGISLSAGESKNVSFWIVIPPGLPAGEYELRAYAKSGSFSTGGAPYAANSAMAKAAFSIANENPNYPLISASSLSVEGQPASASASPIALSDGSNFTASFEVVNNGPAGTMNVQYSLYYVDEAKHAALQTLREEGAVPSSSAPANALAVAQGQFDIEEIMFDEGQLHTITIKPVALPPGTYLFVAVAAKNETRSRISFQVRAGSGSPASLDFAAIIPLPLARGHPATAVACASPALQEQPDALLPASVDISAYSSSTPVFSSSSPVLIGAPSTCANIPFVPDYDAGISDMRALLYDEAGGLIDFAVAEYPQGMVSPPSASLLLESNVLGNMISYHAVLSDTGGNPLEGTLELVLRDSAGGIIDSAAIGFSGGVADGSFAAPEGGYVLEASEKYYKLFASSA
ncbi:MAG: hypothetical protein WC759_05815, partial [Candidatus Micrarchaeia archaeon]